MMKCSQSLDGITPELRKSNEIVHKLWYSITCSQLVFITVSTPHITKIRGLVCVRIYTNSGDSRSWFMKEKGEGKDTGCITGVETLFEKEERVGIQIASLLCYK